MLSGIYCALAFHAADASEFKDSEKAKFLAPCKPPHDSFFAGDAKYWKLISKKLLLTSGNYGRVIEIPSFAPEWAVSVDQFRDDTGGARFAITLTQPVANLFYTLPQPVATDEHGKLVPPAPRRKMPAIKKVAVPIDAELALAIRKTWVAMLQKSEEPPKNSAIALCGGSAYFYSVQMPNGRTEYAALPLVTRKLPGEFAFLGLELKNYCEIPAHQRAHVRHGILQDLAQFNARLANL